MSVIRPNGTYGPRLPTPWEVAQFGYNNAASIGRGADRVYNYLNDRFRPYPQRPGRARVVRGQRKPVPYKRLPKSKKYKPKKKCAPYKRPNRKFAKKVEAVLDKDIPCGELFNYNNELFHMRVIGRQKVVQDMHGRGMFAFAPINVLAAASVLFGNSASAWNPFAVTKAFDANVKIHVERSNVTHTIKNHSNVKMNVTFWTYSPRQLGSDVPKQTWIESIDDYKLNDTGDYAPATISTDKTTALFCKPTQFHGFNMKWKTNKVTFTLQPNGIKSISRAGPCAATYDMTAYNVGNLAEPNYAINAPGKTEWFMITYHLEYDACFNKIDNTLDQVHVLPCTEEIRVGGERSETGGLSWAMKENFCIRAPDAATTDNKVQVKSRNIFIDAATQSQGGFVNRTKYEPKFFGIA